MKLIIVMTRTNRDTNGNTYVTAEITNVKNNKSFTTATPATCNISGILRDFGYKWDDLKVIETNTGSSRITSLPDHIYLDSNVADDNWKKELNKIGLRVKRRK